MAEAHVSQVDYKPAAIGEGVELSPRDSMEGYQHYATESEARLAVKKHVLDLVGPAIRELSWAIDDLWLQREHGKLQGKGAEGKAFTKQIRALEAQKQALQHHCRRQIECR
ncbi:hypothetical protein [Ferrimonas marina]|uniref:hypothetical protein n=1 Tax=Ferrimonas marina TaxID=299255 RepID=UPI0011611C03|nr:hypothetical protein [Ferrimonas marina]